MIPPQIQVDLSSIFTPHLFARLPPPRRLVNMGTSTIHPFRKGTTAIPSELLSMICRELCAANTRKTLTAVARTCNRAYDIALPILYERVRLTEYSSCSVFYGLLCIQPVDPNDHSSKSTKLSHARKCEHSLTSLHSR